MRAALGREVAATMLMAPYLQDDAALIVCASPGVDARNGDEGRLLRHLAHEIVHNFVAEVSGSVKELGNGNVGRRVPAWLDEGLAELVARTVSGRLAAGAAPAPATTAEWTEADVDERLDALDSPDRLQAFGWALSKVTAMAKEVGVAGLFASIRR